MKRLLISLALIGMCFVIPFGYGYAKKEITINNLPEEQKLKVSEDKILTVNNIENDIILYSYISEELVEDEDGEIISKRTSNTKYFNSEEKGKRIMEIALGNPYYKDDDTWYKVKIHKIPKDAFELQTENSIIENIISYIGIALADVDEDIISDTDDAGTVGGSWNTSNNWQNMGYDWAEADKSGLRFQTVAIDNGAVIDVAYITLDCAASSGTMNVKIYGEDADDCSTFSDEANYDVRGTTGGTDWDKTGCTVDASFNSPSLTTEVGNITSRGGWATGQDLCILIKDDGTSSGNYIYYYDFSASEDPPKLHVEWSSGGESSRRIIITK